MKIFVVEDSEGLFDKAFKTIEGAKKYATSMVKDFYTKAIECDAYWLPESKVELATMIFEDIEKVNTRGYLEEVCYIQEAEMEE